MERMDEMKDTENKNELWIEGFYTVRLWCSNCKFRHLIRIEKGVTVADYLDDIRHTCPFCGCETLYQ